jgi:lysostaphin
VSQIYRTFSIVILFSAALIVEAVLLSSRAAMGAGPELTLSPARPKQGQTLVLKVRLPADATPPVVTFDNKAYKLYPLAQQANGTDYRALIGIPGDMAVGSHKLSVADVEQDVDVQSGGFGTQKIRLPKSKDNFIASPGEEEAVGAAKATQSPRQLWKGVFLPPSRARVSTRFGLRRMVNGRLLPDYFHSGLDFAGAAGTPVCATQAGRVILAHTGWRLHGNVVALDHGQGVVTFYLHLSKLLVKPGEMVQAGQEIGKVGSTGRATGPHLHFSVYVNGDATNPADWFTRAM